MSKIILEATQLLVTKGIDKELIDSGKLRVSSILYMLYWSDRLKNNAGEQNSLKNNLSDYLARAQVKSLNASDELIELSRQYIKEIQPVQTVDLVIEKDKQVLLFDRDKFPQGVSLPGGLVDETDEDNPLKIDAKTFAALRVAGQKVLGLDAPVYKTINGEEISYSVESSDGSQKVVIHPKNIYGYQVLENLQAVIRPSDPRHQVDTIGFKCELMGRSTPGYFWESKESLLENKLQHNHNHFAFNHHKEIILHTLAKTSVEQEMNFNENKFVRDIIDNPLVSYKALSERFSSNRFNTHTSFPELFPTVNKMLTEMFTPDINEMCGENEILLGLRDKTVNSLRHVSMKNRTFCPYLPTLNAIFKSIEFFDIVARHKKDFYQDINPHEIFEHNPKEKSNAAYHMYKYKYRMDELMGKIPDEIIIPTFAQLSATDLMKVRGVPIRFVGLSKDFIYVDEFEQSPEEFLMHDINHSYRMSQEDDKYLASMSREQLLSEQDKFLKTYLPTIKISPNDSEQEKELKKIKKIILFEIFHEDAKPALPEIVLSALTRKEGGETKFEVPVIDEKTHYMDIVDTLDTEISTLSYVRNKLQCGFYDKVDKQNTNIVSPKYRKSGFIAQTALDMVYELSIMTKKEVHVDYEYMLKRVCSVGPNNIYAPAQDDENLEKYGDGAAYLNPKRYVSGVAKKI